MRAFLLCPTPSSHLKELMDALWWALYEGQWNTMFDVYHWVIPLLRLAPFRFFICLNSLLDKGNFLKISVNFISYGSDLCFVKHCSSFCSRAGLRNTGASCLASTKVRRADTAAWDVKALPLCMLLPVTYWRTAAFGTAEKCLWFQGAWAVCRNYIDRSHWRF